MKTTDIRVQKEFCAECSLALSRFIGRMKGVGSVEAGDGKVVLTFDEAQIAEEELLRITRENIEKLGYRVMEDK